MFLQISVPWTETQTSDVVLKYIYIYIYREREREKTKLSVTPGHHNVQEGLSMVSCTESITKSKHVLYWKLFTPNFCP